MRITKEQSAENRARILEAAERLFREHGIDAVSVADLMKEAGFTHGGFYNHFESKEDLAAVACAHALTESRKPFVDALAADKAKGWIQYARDYVTANHRDHPEDGCTLACLAADAGRQDASVQAGFAEHVQQMLAAATAHLGDGNVRENAIRQLSELVGALVLARAVVLADPELSDEILEASRKNAESP